MGITMNNRVVVTALIGVATGIVKEIPDRRRNLIVVKFNIDDAKSCFHPHCRIVCVCELGRGEHGNQKRTGGGTENGWCLSMRATEKNYSGNCLRENH
jgi:hypothetical protein